MKKASKRFDLQGIRGIAIIVVLGFHFYPQYMPNGYLGVDQFFVLSGFLMCMLLKRAEKQAPCSLVSLFYSRRLKRILPLYLLIILLSMISLYKFFPDTAIETNKQSAAHALLFVSNRPQTDQEDYFSLLEIAVDIFTHTWSLSVEVQFYFLAPFIFVLGNACFPKLQYLYYGLIACSSYLFFYFSPQTQAFNNVFARTWQFLIGMVVYLLTISQKQNGYKPLLNVEEGTDQKKSEEKCNEVESLGYFEESMENVKKLNPCLLLVILTTAIMFPFPLKDTAVRPLVTMGTAILMLISQENKILSNRLLTYIGDISYSLYLIHWPFYAHWKLTAKGDQFELVQALLASIILATIAYELFEKWYLKLSSANVALLIIILYFSNFLFINKDEIIEQYENYGRNITRMDGISDDMTIEDAEKFNSRWNINDMKNLLNPECPTEFPSPFGWCRHKNLPSSGKYKISIIGNSWTPMHSKLIHQECGYKAKTLLQGSASACEPLYPTLKWPNCSEHFVEFERRIREEQPDYVFILTKHFTVAYPFENNGTDLKEDPIYQVMLNRTRKLLESVKRKIFILDAIPQVVQESVGMIAPMLKNGTDPAEIDKILLITSVFENARIRYAQLIRDCGERCVLMDYKPLFYNEPTGTYRYFDEKGFSYFTTGNHMSPHGHERIRRYWRNLCRKL